MWLDFFSSFDSPIELVWLGFEIQFALSSIARRGRTGLPVGAKRGKWGQIYKSA